MLPHCKTTDSLAAILEIYQLLVFFSTVATAAIGKRRYLYLVSMFWLAWTLVMVFVPWLAALQLAVLSLAFWISLKLIDRREKREVLASSSNPRDKLNGDVFLVTTKAKSLGALDFIRILGRHNISVKKKSKIFPSYRENGLRRALESIEPNLSKGDIVAIVRGGGDVNSNQFDTFRSIESCDKIRTLRRDLSVHFVSGIAHSTDKFPIDECVDYAAISPTHAAFRIAQLKGAELDA